MAKKQKKTFKPKITKRINNLSRAINKIDSELKNRVFGVQHQIADIQPRINDVVYIKDGVEKKVRYDQIENLSVTEQSSLLNQLSVDRFELRQERALQQLQEKGKISWQFKRSLIEDNPVLAQNIEELEDKFEGSTKEALQSEFSGLDITTGEDWYDEADTYFQFGKGSPELFDFYRPGEAGGYSELNIFTWNAYKVERGV
jgi:hypothetical protein